MTPAQIQQYIREAESYVKNRGNPSPAELVQHMRAMAEIVVETKKLYWTRPWEVLESPMHANAVHNFNTAVQKLQELAQEIAVKQSDDVKHDTEFHSVQQVQRLRALQEARNAAERAAIEIEAQRVAEFNRGERI